MTASSQKLLVIGYVWPEPNSSAAGTRMMQLIRSFLNQGYDICFASPAKKGEHQFDLQALGIQEQEILLNDASFDDFLLEFCPGLVIFDRFMMEEQFGWRVEKYCPQAIRVLNTEDLHSLRDARHQLLKNSPSKDSINPEFHPPQSIENKALFAQMSANELAIREISAIYRADLTLMISAFETQLLQSAFAVPDMQLMTLPFMYERVERTATLTFAQRQHFVCIGNFRHAPNWDAVLQLKQLWPQIRQQLPQAEMHIYGAYPPKKATELQNVKQGFLVKGWAEDALEVIATARVMLAPLRFGAGIKGKLAEAMLCGTPSITTPLGAESMCDSPQDWNGAICQDEHTFISIAVQLYQDETLWLNAQEKGFKLFSQRYEQSEYYQSLLFEKLASLKQQLPQHRQNSFTGQMLRFHLHKSTKYMAQWIEAKNKLTSTD